jgi:hypothetical protein
LDANTTASDNTAVGYNALTTNTTGARNTACGKEALKNLSDGDDNTGLGRDALFHCSTGSSNTAVGADAGQNITTGYQNVAIGHDTLDAATTAYDNTAVGYNSGSLVTGHSNTLIGSGVGQGLTTGHSNILIGYKSGNTGNGDNQLYIARSNGGAGSASQWIVGNSAGACTQGNNSSSWTTTSDERLKKNIVDNNKGLAEINQLRVTNFEYKKEDEIDMSEFPLSNDPHQIALGEGHERAIQTGVIAQEIEKVLPESITVSNFGAKTVNTDPIMWAMVNAVKELSTKNDELAAEIATLKSQINN